MTSGWQFLVARGRSTDYRTVLVPDFLADRRLQALIGDSLRSTDDKSTLQTVVIGNAASGPLTVTYRSDVLRPVDMEGARHANDAPAGADYLTDEHGRPLEYLYGIVQPETGSRPPVQADMDRARVEALASYRNILANEEDFTFDRSRPLDLIGGERPALPPTVTPARRPQDSGAPIPPVRVPPGPPPRVPPSPPRPPYELPVPPARYVPPDPPRRPEGRTGSPRRRLRPWLLLLTSAAAVILVLTVIVVGREPSPEGQVTEVAVKIVEPRSGSTVPCIGPLTLQLNVEIKVEDGPVDVTYRWRKNGVNGPLQNESVEKSETRRLTTEIGPPKEGGDALKGEVVLVIDEPRRLESNEETFSYFC